jgi:hypothetical protein
MCSLKVTGIRAWRGGGCMTHVLNVSATVWTGYLDFSTIMLSVGRETAVY